MPKKHVAVIEPFAPHTFLAVRWAQAMRGAGADVTTVTFPSISVEGIHSSPVKPWVPLPSVDIPRVLRGRYNPASRLSVLSQFQRHARHVRSTLEQLLRDSSITHVVVTTSFMTDLPGLRAVREPTQVLALVHGRPMAGRMARSALLGYAGPSAEPTNRWLGCLTEEMREPFVEAGGSPDRVVLAPAAWTTFETRPNNSTADAPVMFAGEAREEKGYGFFVRATPKLLEQGRVRVQTYNLTAVDAETQSLVDKLTVERDPRLELVEARVSDQEYESMIADSSMIALPYDPAAYPHGRISQILSEAWAAGIPVVASRGWWASPIVAEFGGGALFDYGDIDSLAAAVAEVRSDHSAMCERARSGHEAMLAEAGPDAFAKFVLGL